MVFLHFYTVQHSVNTQWEFVDEFIKNGIFNKYISNFYPLNPKSKYYALQHDPNPGTQAAL